MIAAVKLGESSEKAAVTLRPSACTCWSNGLASAPLSDSASWVIRRRSCSSLTTITPWSVPSGSSPSIGHAVAGVRASRCRSLSSGAGTGAPISSIQRLIDDLGMGLKHSAAKRRALCLRLTPADHREIAGQPDHAVAHMLGGRDAVAGRCAVHPLVLVIHRGTLRDDASGGHRMVARRHLRFAHF